MVKVYANQIAIKNRLLHFSVTYFGDISTKQKIYKISRKIAHKSLSCVDMQRTKYFSGGEERTIKSDCRKKG